MRIRQAYRYELDPNNVQRTALAKHAGAARFAWNWGLARRMERFDKNEGKAKFTSAMEQHRELNALKPTEYPWMYEVSKCAPQEALRNLDRTFRHFWRERKKGKAIGFPKPKKKGIHDAFRLTGAISVSGNSVTLPRLGEIRTKEAPNPKGRILSVSVAREADRWYVSLAVERDRPDPVPLSGPVVGIDLGIECFAVASDGTRMESPRPLKKSLKLLKRRSKQHSRKQKGSKNRKKSAIRLSRLHRRIRNQRRDFLHKTTTTLAKTKSMIVVEDLNVSGMIRNRPLGRSIADSGWSEFRRMLEYKTTWYGSTLEVAPRFYSSSSTCSECGYHEKPLSLAQRHWACPQCHAQHDRDVNAAKNLVFLVTGSSPGSDACGDSSVGGTDKLRSTRHESLKQEADAIQGFVLNG